MIKGVKPLTRTGTLNKIAKGTMGPGELAGLKMAEKSIGGIDVIKGLVKSGKNVERAKGLQKTAGAVGITGAGYGIYDLLKRVVSK